MLRSAAQQCDSVMHIQKYIIFFLFFFMWFITGYLIYFLMLYSRTLWFIIPLYPQLPVISFRISPSNEYSRLISFSIDWLDLHAVQGNLKSLFLESQLESINSSVLSLIMVHLSHPNMNTGKIIALTIQIFVSKVISLHFNMQSKFVIAFLFF